MTLVDDPAKDHLMDPFAAPSTIDPLFSKPDKRFGRTYNGRYHMPRLPGDIPAKGHVPWEPRGMMRTTNLVGAFADQRALTIWELEQASIGLAKSISLYEQLVMDVQRWEAGGVDLLRIRDFPHVRKALTGTPQDSDDCYVGRAKEVSGANEAREQGTNRHTAWEHRAVIGDLIGTPAIQEQILSVEALLLAARLERVPGLSERVIRNEEVGCAGKFDDVLRHMDTGELFMSDYKSKKRPFFTWMEVDAQLAIYANSRWMLDDAGQGYVAGPHGVVNMERGVVLHVPSDGGTPYLRKANLVRGWRIAKLAREVVDERAYGKSAEREALSHWTG